MPPVKMKDATGATFDVPEDQVQIYADRGFTPVSEVERLGDIRQEAFDEEYGGVRGKIGATGAAVLRGVSGGGSDLIIRGLGGGDTLRNLKEANPTLSTVAEVGSAFLPVGLPGLAARAGKVVGKVDDAAGALAKIGGAAKGAAVEGAIFGAGQGVSEVALSKEPLTLERAISSIGSNALFGGAIGGAAGGVLKAGGIGLRAAKSKLDDIAARGTGEVDDAARVAAADQVKAYRASVKEANPWSAIDEGEASKLLTKSDRSLRSLMDDPKGLAQRPDAALKALRIQEQALMRALDDVDDIAAKLTAKTKQMGVELQERVSKLTYSSRTGVDLTLEGPLARRYASWANVKVPKGGKVDLSREKGGEFAAALINGEVSAAGSNALKKLPGLLESNRGLQATIEAATKKPVAGAASGGLAGNMLGGTAFGTAASVVGSIPVVGPLLAPFAGSAASKLVTEGLGKMATKQAARASQAIGAFLKVGEKIAPAAPVLASKVLAAARFAPDTPKQKPTKEPKKGSAAPRIAKDYKARTDEIKSQTAYNVDGKAEMRPEARMRMATTFDGIRQIDPVLADKLETLAARKLEFLANRIPRKADVFGLNVGPDNWQPSDMSMRAFARYVAAVEDPNGVLDRLATGQITPEDAEAMREVYPEIFADVQRQIMEQLPTLQKTLPYHRRLALSIFSGVPVDAAMHPRILAVLQRSFAEEEGSEGGTQAPMPEPAFGSVKNQEATPAQQRQMT